MNFPPKTKKPHKPHHLIFQSSFRFRAKLSKKYRVPISSGPILTYHPVVPHQGSMIVIIELTLTHRYHPNPQFTLGFTYCTFYGLGQMYDMYPQLQYHTEQFHCSKYPLCYTCSSLPPPNPWQPQVLLSPVLPFAEYHIVRIIRHLCHAYQSSFF